MFEKFVEEFKRFRILHHPSPPLALVISVFSFLFFFFFNYSVVQLLFSSTARSCANDLHPQSTQGSTRGVI